MEFNIRQRATLPYLEVNLIKSGRLDYNYIKTDLSNATINFYMKNVDNGFYKVAKGDVFYSAEINSLYFQFNKRNTSELGRFEGEFKITTDQGDVILPLREKIFINVLKSFSDPDFCCPNKSINPVPIPPIPEPPGIYYGKFSGETITSGNVNNLLFKLTNDPTNNYITYPETVIPEYGYILIPIDSPQPSDFRDSDEGCDNFNIPTNLINTIIIKNGNGFLITYNVYRTFWPFIGEVNCWLCV